MSWALWLQVFSPIVIVLGIAYRCASLWYLRERQKSAIKSLCEDLYHALQITDRMELARRMKRIRLLAAHYDKAIFGSRSPFGLLDDMIDLLALIESVEEFLENNRSTAEIQPSWLAPFAREASRIAGRSRLVLFTL